MKKPSRHWIGAEIFTLCIVVLIVAAAGGGQSPFLFVMMAVIVVGVALFYLLFPGSYLFSISLANCLALYLCIFVFLLETNFRNASGFAIQIGFAMPVFAFIGGSLLYRRQIRKIVTTTHYKGQKELVRGLIWLLPLAAIGTATFAIPRLGLDPKEVNLALILAMAMVALVVLLTSHGLSSFMLHSGLVFEQFFERITRVIVPAFAFLTFYSLLIIVFACVFRIVDLYVPGQHFNFNGAPYEISFSESLYFSIVSMSTLGYGDITPVSGLVRAVVGVQIVAGVLLLLFGFSEIMRYSQEHDQEDHDPSDQLD